jgi:hypothetical protein
LGAFGLQSFIRVLNSANRILTFCWKNSIGVSTIKNAEFDAKSESDEKIAKSHAKKSSTKKKWKMDFYFRL